MACRSRTSECVTRLFVGIAGAVLFFALRNSSLALTTPPGRSGVKCKVQGATDTEGSGLTAFRFLVPEGWKANTSFRWIPPSNTAFACDLSVSTPDLHSMVDCVEHMVMTYMSGFGSQPGKGVLIQKATDMLRYRAGKLTTALKGVSDVSIVDEENTELPPDIAQQMGMRLGSGDSMHSRTFLHQAGYLKVRFKIGETVMTAELGTQVFGETSVVRIPGQSRPSSMSQVNRVGPTVTIMLESNASEVRKTEAKIIASSFQMTPEFQAYWVKLTTHAGKVVLGENRAELEASNSNWHERSMANFRKQMDAKSATTHDFCNMAANQQDYKMGDAIVTLPNDYKGWWDPHAGVLMIGADPKFVPSGAGTQNFQELHPATHGHD